MPSSLDQLLASLPQQKYPPVDQWHPERKGQIDIRIAGDGTWFHEGGAIKRSALVRLFASILRRDDEGYWLVTPAEQLKIRVDDAPLLVTALHSTGCGEAQQLVFSTSTDDQVVVNSQHPIWVNDPEQNPAPYVHVRTGLNARISRSTFYQLVALAVEREVQGVPSLGLWSCGEFFPLAPRRESADG